jgi:hypothetical protein
MLDTLREQFTSILGKQPWTQELAGILPLSALVDFLDLTRSLHVHQLCGALPLWSWSVAPSGSRLLLSGLKSTESCYLDRFENCPKIPQCLDGRYGDKYYMANPETLKLCLEDVKTTKIVNSHENMQRDDGRVQNLDIVFVRRLKPGTKQVSPFGAVASAFGWVLLIICTAIAIWLGLWFMVSYLMLVTLTGVVISVVNSGQPRRLSGNQGSNFSRIVISSQHTNETNWVVFTGESSIVNSLLNRPLKPNVRRDLGSAALSVALRGLVFGQWVVAIGAAAMKGWDAYGITFWILFCIISHRVFFSAKSSAKDWLTRYAEIDIQRFQIVLSSRRALLNAIMALNPDSFPKEASNDQTILDRLDEQGLRWMDSILAPSSDRRRWQEASRVAMAEELYKLLPENQRKECAPNEDWKEVYKSYYWCRYISEGIQIAAKIREEINLCMAGVLQTGNQ